MTQCLNCRWSHRTATAQRRKDRHRQQTEHLGLDNDLKEVQNWSRPLTLCRVQARPYFLFVSWPHISVGFCSTSFLLASVWAFFPILFESLHVHAAVCCFVLSALLFLSSPVCWCALCLSVRGVGSYPSSSSSAGGGLSGPAELHGLLGVGQSIPSTCQTA